MPCMIQPGQNDNPKSTPMSTKTEIMPRAKRMKIISMILSLFIKFECVQVI